jgi:hypothetical protein
MEKTTPLSLRVVDPRQEALCCSPDGADLQPFPKTPVPKRMRLVRDKETARLHLGRHRALEAGDRGSDHQGELSMRHPGGLAAAGLALRELNTVPVLCVATAA